MGADDKNDSYACKLEHKMYIYIYILIKPSFYSLMSTLAFDVGTVNMCLCVAEHGHVRHWSLFSIGAKNDPLAKLIEQLLAVLQQQAESIGRVQHVRIEQQLGRAATKNFALSAAIFAYCLMKYPDADTQYVNPRRKFKLLGAMTDVPGISERSEEILNTRGRSLKKLAVELSKALAEHNDDTPYMLQLASLSKKDDLSDCHLMACLC